MPQTSIFLILYNSIFFTISGHKVTHFPPSLFHVSSFFLNFSPLPNLGIIISLLESSTTKGSKICFSSSEEHPIPVSCTTRQFSPFSVFSQRTSTWRRDWSKAVISSLQVEFFFVEKPKTIKRGTCWVPII